MLMCFLIEKQEITKHRSHFMYKTEGFPGLIQHKTHVTNKGEHKTTLENNVECQIKMVK